jgi:hypothetical protein
MNMKQKSLVQIRPCGADTHPDATQLVISVSSKFVLYRWRWCAYYTHDYDADYGRAWGATRDDAIRDLVTFRIPDYLFMAMSNAQTLDELKSDPSSFYSE